MGRSFLWVIAPCLALGACSSSTNSGGNDGQGSDETSNGSDAPGSDDADSPDAASTMPDGAVGSTGAAGKAGADAFCSRICSHEETCATTLDASPAGLADCMSNCQSVNETPTTSPPTELLRADYLSRLGACIANASCGDALRTSEAGCASALVSGSGAADVHSLVPTRAVAVFCHDLETSPCAAPDSGASDCVTAFLPYSDDALDAAIACFASASCSALAACYTAAFTQK